MRVHITHQTDIVARQAHQDIILHICVEICACHVCGCNVPLLKSIDHQCQKDGIRQGCRRRSLSLVIQVLLGTPVCTCASLDLPAPFLFYNIDASECLVFHVLGDIRRLDGLENPFLIQLTEFSMHSVACRVTEPADAGSRRHLGHHPPVQDALLFGRT